MSKPKVLALALTMILVGLLCLAFVPGLLRDAVYASDAPATKIAVTKIVPIGSSIDMARTTMEAKGFQCMMRHNSKFADDGVTQPAADFLYCDSGEQTVGPLITKRWQVGFVDKGGVVQSIVVGVGLTGP